MNKLNEFLTYLEVEKRYSINTINAYKRDLTDFNKFLIKEEIKEVDDIAIKNYLASLYLINLTKKTIARRIASIKSYYKFINKKYGINNEFVNSVSSPKKDKLLPELIYKEEIQKILNYNFNGKFCYRNKAIINLLYSSGVRVSELCNITLPLINLEDRYLIVVGKGKKTRICPFSSDSKRIIENYLVMERNKIAKCNYLFINKYGNKLTTRAVENIINELSVRLFNNKKLHPHLFRHTYATNLLNNGADLRTVQELLGHSSLNATQVYTHLANKDIENIYKISHPREQTN